MELMGQWAPSVQKDQSAGKKGLGDKLGWFAFPAVTGGAGAATDGVGGGNGIAVSKNAPPEAVDFLKFFMEHGEPGQAQHRRRRPLDDRRHREHGHRPEPAGRSSPVAARPRSCSSTSTRRPRRRCGSAINDATVALFLGKSDPGEGLPGHHRRGCHAVSVSREWITRRLGITGGPAQPARLIPSEASRDVLRAERPGTRSGPRLPGKWLTISLFLLPALALYLVFVIVPIIQAAHFSLYKWNGLGPLDDFIGLKNYQVALASDVFWQAVSNNVLIIVLSLLLQIPFSLGLAVLLNRRFPGRAIFRLLFFVPYVLVRGDHRDRLPACCSSPTPSSTRALTTVGLEGLIQDWLGNTDIVMITLFVIISWKYFGFHMILLLAGLQGIPREIEEAALIDGAGRWQAFRYVTLPLIGPTLRVSIFLSIIGALQLFDLVWVMTGGGPAQRLDHDGRQHVQDRVREAADGLRQRARRAPVPVRPRRRPRSTSGSSSVATSTAP